MPNEIISIFPAIQNLNIAASETSAGDTDPSILPVYWVNQKQYPNRRTLVKYGTIGSPTQLLFDQISFEVVCAWPF